jgi:hypothetical protein
MDEKFTAQLIAELKHRHETLHVATEQAFAMLATATARQTNADVLAQNLERLEALFARQTPNEVRSQMIQKAISLVRNSGTPQAGQAH